MGEFTKGPWIAMQQTGRDGRALGWIIEAPDGSRIGWSSYADAATNKGDEPPYIQSGHNARLIAAAPDLLEAVEAFHAVPHPCGESCSVRAAIAKATGAQP